jgi:hypothetical protein
MPEASPTAAPSLAPGPTLSGAFPGPSATVPPEVFVIPGLRLAPLADLWQSLGLSCVSHVGAFPDSAGGYGVHCEATDQSMNIDVVADAIYWTSDDIEWVSIMFNPIVENAIDAPAAAERWLYPVAALTGGDKLASWVREPVGSTSCGVGCDAVVGGIPSEYDYGRLGAQALHMGK